MPSSSDPCDSSTESARAADLISSLGLIYLPKESGYIGILGRSSKLVRTATATGDGRELAAQSHNYYMLTAKLPVNYIHWLESDDSHILVEGGPLDYYIFYPETEGVSAKVEKVTLGMDTEKGHRPVVAVPGGCWKALKLHHGVDYALTVNVLSPEFTEDRVKIGEGRDWVGRYMGKADWASESFLMELIGPNWVQNHGT